MKIKHCMWQWLYIRRNFFLVIFYKNDVIPSCKLVDETFESSLKNPVKQRRHHYLCAALISVHSGFAEAKFKRHFTYIKHVTRLQNGFLQLHNMSSQSTFHTHTHTHTHTLCETIFNWNSFLHQRKKIRKVYPMAGEVFVHLNRQIIEITHEHQLSVRGSRSIIMSCMLPSCQTPHVSSFYHHVKY